MVASPRRAPSSSCCGTLLWLSTARLAAACKGQGVYAPVQRAPRCAVACMTTVWHTPSVSVNVWTAHCKG